MQVRGHRVLSNCLLPDEMNTPKLPMSMSIVLLKQLSMEVFLNLTGYEAEIIEHRIKFTYDRT